MVDLMLLLLMVIQATVDISREVQWASSPKSIRINRQNNVSLFLPSIALALLLAGKFYFAVTGLPTLGLLSLYLIMLFYFMYAYPYIIVSDSETHICTHALQPNITITKSHITSVRKENHLLRIEYHPEDSPMQRIILDTRSFPKIMFLENWLGLTPKIEKLDTGEVQPPLKKAA